MQRTQIGGAVQIESSWRNDFSKGNFSVYGKKIHMEIFIDCRTLTAGGPPNKASKKYDKAIRSLALLPRHVPHLNFLVLPCHSSTLAPMTRNPGQAKFCSQRTLFALRPTLLLIFLLINP